MNKFHNIILEQIIHFILDFYRYIFFLPGFRLELFFIVVRMNLFLLAIAELKSHTKYKKKTI